MVRTKKEGSILAWVIKTEARDGKARPVEFWETKPFQEKHGGLWRD